MPIYEYSCHQCGSITEFLTGLGGKNPEIQCGKCGSKDMEKVLSAPNVVTSDSQHPQGMTCCGREERCSTPSCEAGESCRRGQR